MGQIFQNPTGRTKRQTSYFANRKTDRKPVVKHEQIMQLEASSWTRQTFPGLHFRSDTGSGAFSSTHEKDIHNRMQSGTSEPDMSFFAARRGFHGLVLELKADGVDLKMKRDGRKIRVYKDSKGKIIERDYKIRLKGDWASLHIERQALCLEDYVKNGYCAKFVVGLEDYKKMLCWYFDIPYENASLLDSSAF